MRRVSLPLVAAVVVSLNALPPPPMAAALPPGFPDLSRFSAVDPAPYVDVGYKGNSIKFVTDHLTCDWQLPTHPDEQGSSAGCFGDIPGIPAEVPHGENACDGISMGGPRGASPLYTFSRGTGSCAPPEGSRRLPVGAKITAVNITCAVTPDGVACVDPIVNHGFVLQHPLSWVF